MNKTLTGKGLVWSICIFLGLSGCARADKPLDMEESSSAQTWEPREEFDRGYDLPVKESERKEAEEECRKALALISDEELAGCGAYSNVKNYEEAERFLKACMTGKSGSVVIYGLHSDNSIERDKYIFDGANLYLLAANAKRNEKNEPKLSSISYNRIKEWTYTDKGWFCYQLCVPEPPEVTEIIDGSRMIRIKPMDEECRRLSEMCVFPLGYQGNNLLCSNWDTGHLGELDYNGMYEYLYKMKYQKNFDAGNYPNGIPKEEFEKVIMEYIPITPEQIQKYAAFDEENQTYEWEGTGCFNYVPTFFGTSIPEVTYIRENQDGTVTLTVDAVCEMVLCDEAVITHELTMQFWEDGSFKYLGNKILGDGLQKIPDYQYRRENR